MPHLSLSRMRAPRLVWGSNAPPLARWEMVFLGIILSYGMVLRSWDLGSMPLWVDEAETCINALTILQHGVPGDRYLGLPVFENTFSRPWPESEEYEFRDTSYSDKGLAIYHGWFPIYAVATAFAIAGVEPDGERHEMSVLHSREEMQRRTLIARLPAVLFGLVFLLAVFFAGRVIYGRDAGWAALSAAAVSSSCINFSRQARYYSSTLALSALCCLLLYLMLRRGRWRDFLVGAVFFVLLFHTNILSFVVLCVTGALVVPFLLHHTRILAKLLLFTGTVAAGTVPWAVLSGFMDSHADLPKARSLLSWSQILDYPTERLALALPALLLLGFLAAAWPYRRRIPQRLIFPFEGSRRAFFFLAAWSFTGFVMFVAFIPAASYFYSRITLVLMVPALLFGALLFAAAARACHHRYSYALAPALFVIFLALTGMATFRGYSLGTATPPIYEVISRLRKLDIPPGTRLYTNSGSNLVLRFYTGLPVQNVMPVRKSFLDNYPGEIFILESPPYDWLAWRKFHQYMVSSGRPLTPAEARRMLRDLSGPLLREDLKTRVSEILPDAEAAPDFLQPLVRELREKTAEKVSADVKITGNPMFDGYSIPDYTAMWQVFFYRFVKPEERMGAHLNYADRIRTATAYVLPEEWVLIHCPALDGPDHVAATASDLSPPIR